MTDTTDTPISAPVVLTIAERGDFEARKAFNAAFAAAQGEFAPILKNREVTIKPREGSAYTFRFADLQEIHAKTRPGLSSNGLSTTAQMIPEEKGVLLVLALAHAQGFERVSEVFCAYGEDIKQFGGRLSYMRRYMLQNLLDVAADDDLDESGNDDTGGQQASTPTKAPPPKPTPQRRAQTPAAPPAVGQFDGPKGGAGKPEDDMPEVPPMDELVKDVQPAAAAAKPPAQAAAKVEAQKPAATPAATPAAPPADAPAEQPVKELPEETAGERAAVGEVKFLLKRAKQRGADIAAAMVAAGIKRKLDPTTLDDLTKAEWQLLLQQV